jgi:hypothetical protein
MMRSQGALVIALAVHPLRDHPRPLCGRITVKPDEEIRCSLNVEVWGGHA